MCITTSQTSHSTNEEKHHARRSHHRLGPFLGRKPTAICLAAGKLGGLIWQILFFLANDHPSSEDAGRQTGQTRGDAADRGEHVSAVSHWMVRCCRTTCHPAISMIIWDLTWVQATTLSAENPENTVGRLTSTAASTAASILIPPTSENIAHYR